MNARQEDERKDENEENIDHLADDIVGLLVNYVDSKSGLEKRNLMEIEKIKSRISALENRVEKYIKDFKLATIESSRALSEKSEESRSENERTLLKVQEQVGDLRRLVVSLDERIKKLDDRIKKS